MIVMKIQLEDTADGLSAVFLSGLNSVTQHNRGVNVIEVIPMGFNLAEDETLHIAFADGVEEGNINQEELAYALMKFDRESATYKCKVPAQVISKRGTWYLCLAIRSGWNADEGTYTYQRATGYRPFEVYSSIANNGYPVPSEADIAVLYLSLKETENNVAESASEAASAAARAEGAAKSAKQYAEQATESKNSAETAVNAANTAKDSMNAALAAQAAAESAQNAADEAARHAASKAIETLKSAEDALLSAENAKEQADIAAALLEQFASYGVKINTDYSSFDELPIPGNANSIYFIPNGGEGTNSFDEWVWIASKNAYEKIGTTAVDLSAYLTRKEAVETYATKEELFDYAAEASGTYATKEELSDYATEVAETYATKGEIGVSSVNGATGNIEITKSDVGLSNVDNVKQYSESNPPPYPVVTNGTYSNMTVGNATNANNANQAINDDTGNSISKQFTAISNSLSSLKDSLLKSLYPVGSIYITLSSTNTPASIIGGSWIRLPDGVVLWTVTSGVTQNLTAAANTASNSIAAGLPNIKGTLPRLRTITADGTNGSDGVFSWSAESQNAGGSSSTKFVSIDIDASRLSSIYSDSVDTVQPPAYKVYAWRRYA